MDCLHNSQDITADFLKEVESNILVHSSGYTVRCFGITKDPKTNDFMMVMELKDYSLRQRLNNSFILMSWENMLFTLHSIATEPKNADDNDDLHGIEYSDSLKMDFTKLDINSKDETN
ncbi:kinase-like domain-containing protein [Rhizophagus irregularis DAOM 181602=DAOM 197198]|nr:kinase-like domain-containing protein [Rhizophagus irregularis DAOM 181602=DAOM 197198]